MSRMPFLIRIARLTYGRMLQAKGKVSLRNECGADLKKGPYLYLINHVGIMDPVMISAVLPQHVRWVAGAYLFKNWFLKLVIGKWCTAIPKQQGRRDLSMIRNIHSAFKNGDNVGLFPEGTRTWDGEMMPVKYVSLAKFVKRYKVPVLVVHLEGGYAHHPRWADFERKGKVVVNVKYLLTSEQIESAPVDELSDTLRDYMHFSNDEWKQTVDYSYVCDKRAEGLQRLLYMCPKCRSLDTMRTAGNKITCSSCGAITVLDDMDNLTSIETPFTTLKDWHTWESSEICKLEGFPKEDGVLLQTGDANNDGELQTISTKISVQLRNDVLYVDCSDDCQGKNHYELPMSNISSLVLNAKQTMELFCDDVLYRIRLLPEANALKYQEYFIFKIKSARNVGGDK